MFSKTLVTIAISSLLLLTAASPLPALNIQAHRALESTALNITATPSSENVKRAPKAQGTLVLYLSGCTQEIVQWASYNPGRLTAKQDGILYGSIIPLGGLYLAVDARDADIIGRAFKCPNGKFVVVEYYFDGNGLRIVDMTAGQRYDDAAHAVIGYFDPSRAGIRAPHMKMYVLQNPIALTEAHLRIKMINHKDERYP